VVTLSSQLFLPQLNHPFVITVIAEVALFTDLSFRRFLDREILIENLGDYLVKVVAGSIYQLRPIGKNHQGIFFLGLAGPVNEEAIRTFQKPPSQ